MGKNNIKIKVLLLFLALILALVSCHREEEKYAQKLMQTLDKGKMIKTRNSMDQIAHCLNRYVLDHGMYPEAEELGSAVSLLVPQYASDLSRYDAWNNKLAYSSDGSQFTLTSAGEDEKFHTEDDIIMVDGIYH